jgi:cyanophycinase
VTALPRPRPLPCGSLFLIGGAEARDERMTVLARLVALSGAREAGVVVLSAASNRQTEAQHAYAQAFAMLGVRRCEAVVIEQRAEADDVQRAEVIGRARLVFITGGDQRRLVARVGGTRVGAALGQALAANGACIAGTSAGAAALSASMLAPEAGDDGPHNDGELSPGLGLAPGLVIDQHFTQRQRLRRLLQAVAEQPQLLGVGIDEDTALHLAPGHGLEVVGQGAVTLVDGEGVAPGAAVDALHLHRLRAGQRHDARGLDEAQGAPASLAGLLRRLLRGAEVAA